MSYGSIGGLQQQGGSRVGKSSRVKEELGGGGVAVRGRLMRDEWGRGNLERYIDRKRKPKRKVDHS